MRKNKKQDEIVERFSPSQSDGLSLEQVSKRISQKLVNNTKQKTSKSYLRIFTDNIFTFFNMLWLAIFIALIVVKSYENLLFIIVIIFNTAIAIFQEIRSKRTVEKLSLITAPKITVVRGGKEEEIFSNEIVLDDVLVLSTGNQIPADCVILSGTVDVNESLLTGESKPIKKESGQTLLAGSFLTSGKCYARADKVGNDNYIQSLAKAAKSFKQPNSNLFKDLNKIIKGIGLFIIPIGALVFCNNYFWAKTASGAPASSVGNLAESISSTCGSLVGMIPAGMFLLISVALTVGVIRLSEKKTLVQDIYSIEMLARSNVLCLDKTGTITDGTMTVKQVVCYGAKEEEIKDAISSMMAVQPTQNSTSRALCKHFGTEQVLTSTANIAFSSDRKYTATSFSNGETYVIGANEYIKAKISEQISQEILSASSAGYRVLTVARGKGEISGEKLPSGLEVVAIVLIEDTIRKDAIETIKWFKNNNVEIKIISGDDPKTVSTIAGRVGVENSDKYINLEGVSLEEVKVLAKQYTVFGRVSPEQKHAIIKSLKESNVVAMTGDGVNDTLALKEADCSIAMADGSEVARNISHLVLLNSNFSSLPSVVEEGRKVINNVQKSSTLFFMKTVLAILLSVFCVAIQIKYPFYPKNMFLLELFVIGIPSFFLALQPNKDLIRGGFIKYVLKRGIPYGLVIFLNVITITLLWKFNVISPAENQTLTTLMLTISGFLNLFSLCFPYTKYKVAIVCFSAICLVAAGLIMPGFFGIGALTPYVVRIGLVLSLLTLVLHLVVINVKYNIGFKRKKHESNKN